MSGLDVPTIAELRQRGSTHQIWSLAPTDNLVTLKVILLEAVQSMTHRSGDYMAQFLIADHSGSILCNFYGEFAKQLKEGDIMFWEGFYCKIYKGTLTLYMGKKSNCWKMGGFFMSFSETPQMSEIVWEPGRNGGYVRK